MTQRHSLPSFRFDSWASRMLADSVSVWRRNVYIPAVTRLEQKNEYLESSGGVWISYPLSDEVTSHHQYSERGGFLLIYCLALHRECLFLAPSPLYNSGGIPHGHGFAGLSSLLVAVGVAVS